MPTDLVTRQASLDLGGRTVELLPLAPGHTDNDLVVHVPDVRAWVVGDVLEESGPPVYGSGCFPLHWPDSLAGLLAQVGPDDVVVPGHGSPVTRQFGLAQLAQLEAVAARIQAVHAAGATVDQTLSAQTGWPFPVDALGLALSRGFTHLDSSPS